MKDGRMKYWAAAVFAACLVSSGVAEAGWWSHNKSDTSGQTAAGQSGATTQDESGCRCFRPLAPPRAPVATAFAGLINPQTPPTAEGQSGALNTDLNGRVESLENDLARLTVVVEKILENQKEHQNDLTRISVLLDQLIKDRTTSGAAPNP